MRLRRVYAPDVARVLMAVGPVELIRRSLGLHRAAAIVRRLAARQPSRSPDSRMRLRRIIDAVDRRFPGGPNCLRRSLVEIALDSGAASERFYAGFRSGGREKSGHAWLASHEAPDTPYDVVIAV